MVFAAISPVPLLGAGKIFPQFFENFAESGFPVNGWLVMDSAEIRDESHAVSLSRHAHPMLVTQ
jgi:hypothetical protein